MTLSGARTVDFFSCSFPMEIFPGAGAFLFPCALQPGTSDACAAAGRVAILLCAQAVPALLLRAVEGLVRGLEHGLGLGMLLVAARHADADGYGHRLSGPAARLDALGLPARPFTAPDHEPG